MKKYFLVFSLLIISCSDGERENRKKTEEMRELMIGKWCGEVTLTNGKYQKWIVNRFRDGTYKIDFLTEGLREYGIWGVRYPVYFTVMQSFHPKKANRPVDSSDPKYYDAYKIISLSKDEFKYKSYGSGNLFSVNKKCDKKD